MLHHRSVGNFLSGHYIFLNYLLGGGCAEARYGNENRPGARDSLPDLGTETRLEVVHAGMDYRGGNFALVSLLNNKRYRETRLGVRRQGSHPKPGGGGGLSPCAYHRRRVSTGTHGWRSE